MKKAITITVIILITAAALYIGVKYIIPLLFQTPAEINNSAPARLPQRITKITQEEVWGYWVGKKGLIYAITKGGDITTYSGSKNAVVGVVPNKIDAIRPAPDGSSAIIAFKTENGRQFSIFNTETSSWSPLPVGTTAADWNPTGTKIAYVVDDGSTSSLYTKTTSAQKDKLILKAQFKNSDLDWVTEENILIREKPAADIGSAAWMINTHNNTINVFAKNETGLLISWAPDGSFGLKFSNGLLTVINSQNQLINPTMIELTLPSKCDVLANEVFCAIPRSIPGNSRLPDDYIKRRLYTNDYFIAWTPKQGTVADIFSSNWSVDAEQISVNDNYLYFINRYDRKIYRLAL